jgi:pentatricopeptide repeat protein
MIAFIFIIAFSIAVCIYGISFSLHSGNSLLIILFPIIFLFILACAIKILLKYLPFYLSYYYYSKNNYLKSASFLKYVKDTSKYPKYYQAWLFYLFGIASFGENKYAEAIVYFKDCLNSGGVGIHRQALIPMLIQSLIKTDKVEEAKKYLDDMYDCGEEVKAKIQALFKEAAIH